MDPQHLVNQQDVSYPAVALPGVGDTNGLDHHLWGTPRGFAPFKLQRRRRSLTARAAWAYLFSALAIAAVLVSCFRALHVGKVLARTGRRLSGSSSDSEEAAAEEQIAELCLDLEEELGLGSNLPQPAPLPSSEEAIGALKQYLSGESKVSSPGVASVTPPETSADESAGPSTGLPSYGSVQGVAGKALFLPAFYGYSSFPQESGGSGILAGPSGRKRPSSVKESSGDWGLPWSSGEGTSSSGFPPAKRRSPPSQTSYDPFKSTVQHAIPSTYGGPTSGGMQVSPAPSTSAAPQRSPRAPHAPPQESEDDEEDDEELLSIVRARVESWPTSPSEGLVPFAFEKSLQEAGKKERASSAMKGSVGGAPMSERMQALPVPTTSTTPQTSPRAPHAPPQESEKEGDEEEDLYAAVESLMKVWPTSPSEASGSSLLEELLEEAGEKESEDSLGFLTEGMGTGAPTSEGMRASPVPTTSTAQTSPRAPHTSPQERKEEDKEDENLFSALERFMEGLPTSPSEVSGASLLDELLEEAEEQERASSSTEGAGNFAPTSEGMQASPVPTTSTAQTSPRAPHASPQGSKKEEEKDENLFLALEGFMESLPTSPSEASRASLLDELLEEAEEQERASSSAEGAGIIAPTSEGMQASPVPTTSTAPQTLPRAPHALPQEGEEEAEDDEDFLPAMKRLMEHLPASPSDDSGTSALEKFLEEAEQKERRSSPGSSSESSSDETLTGSLLEKFSTETAPSSSQFPAGESAGTSASGAAAAASSSAAPAGEPGPRCHPFYAVPMLMPGKVRELDVLWVLRPSRQHNLFLYLSKMRDLLESRFLLPSDASKLVAAAEQVISWVKTEASAHPVESTLGHAVYEAGMMYLALDAILAASAVLGPHMKLEQWWGPIIEKVPVKHCRLPLGSSLASTEKKVRLLAQLNSAVEKLKTGRRLTEEETVYLKRKLLCYLPVSGFALPRWEPWRKQDADWKRSQGGD